MKNKLLVGGIAVALLSFGAVGTSLAYQGDYAKRGPNYSADRESQMTNVMNSGDYEGWKKLMDGKGRVTDVINKNNFGSFAKAWKLAKSGKIEEANLIRAELGLKGEKSGRVGLRNQGKGKNRAIHSFVDNNKDGKCDNQQ